MSIFSVFFICMIVYGAVVIYLDIYNRQSQDKKLFDSLDESNNRQVEKKNHENKIVYPKYPNVGKFITYLSYLILGVVLISSIYLFLVQESCQDVFGWNVDFLRNLLIFTLVSIYAIFSFEKIWNFFRLRTNTGKYYPNLDKQPLLFKKECTLISKIYIKESKSKSIKAIIDTAIMVLIYVICFIIIIEPILPIFQSNESYQQACLSELTEVKKTKM